MAFTTILAALALVQAPAQAPAIQAPATQVPAIPVSATPTPLREYRRLFATPQDGRRVTLRFEGASLKEVLDRLQKEKVDFAVDADAFQGRKIALSLTDVPLSVALDAIGAALDAHWEAVGSVQVLKKGARSGAFGTLGAGTFGRGTLDERTFRSFALPVLPNLNPSGHKEAVDALEKARKTIAEADGMSQEARKAALDAIEAARKSLAERRSIDILPKGAYEFKSLSPQQDEASRKALERIFERSGPLKSYVDRQNVDALMKSLTPAQKELQKKQGYLKPSDLTAEQRKMAGLDGQGTVEIAITAKGQTLKIKGE